MFHQSHDCQKLQTGIFLVRIYLFQEESWQTRSRSSLYSVHSRHSKGSIHCTLLVFGSVRNVFEIGHT